MKSLCKFLNDMKNWLKENWFKFLIAFAIILISLSIFYYFVVFTSQKDHDKEVQFQKQAQTMVDNKYWDDLKNKTQGMINDESEVRSGADDSIRRTRKWLNGIYPLKNDPSYYKLIPLVNASEHYITTEKNLIDSLDIAISIKYRKITVIEQRDQLALDRIVMEENDADSTVSYWITQTQKELEQIEVLKTETIKNN